MKKYLLLIIVLTCKNVFSQNTNVYDFAPSAKVTTNGTVSGGGATARSFSSNIFLGVNQYIILDCGTPVPVNIITFGTFWSSDSRYIPKGYTIDYSNDGTSWSNIVTVPNNSNLSPGHSINLTMRYWKLTVTATQTGETGSSIAGLQLLANGVGAATNNSFWNGGGYGSTSIHTTAGNVGIGTSTPNSKLSVVTDALGSNNGDRANLTYFETGVGGNTSFVELYSYRNASGNDWLSATTRLQQKVDASGMGYIEFNPPGMTWGLALGTNNTGRLYIGNNGNVGIGTMSINDDAYALFVQKGIRTRKVKVDQAVWPDYVFHPGYRLRPLSEVEQYIQQHHHLPEVPSEAEVKKDGLDLGDNQVTLLKKIEELTLYLIEQNKKLEGQNKRIEKLEAANEQLRQENKNY